MMTAQWITKGAIAQHSAFLAGCLPKHKPLYPSVSGLVPVAGESDYCNVQVWRNARFAQRSGLIRPFLLERNGYWRTLQAFNRIMDPPGIFHRIAASTEEAVDMARRRIWQRTGGNKPRQIVAYRGYANAQKVHLSGRVLANKPGGGPLDDDGWWKNLLNTYSRWESDEVPFAEITVTFGNEEILTETDEEGYYFAEFLAPQKRSETLLWHTASVCAGTQDDKIHAVHQVMLPPASPEYGIISDLDDTVIHTGITSILLAAKLTFLENAKTRKPLDGVAQLYRAFQKGMNPLFYISSSPWNLHDLLEDFLTLNDIPPGPILLRDLGLDKTKFIKEKGHGHKFDKAIRILDEFPTLPFILVGDSGQEDPMIYADVVKHRPGRVKAIYIRDIDPDADSHLDEAVRKAIVDTEIMGVPMILAKDSLAISKHAVEIGLIRPAALAEVKSEVTRDQQRPEIAEQIVEEAFSMTRPDSVGT